MPPNQNRRAERAKRAKETVNKSIPDILRASPRARHAIHKADLIVDPSGSTPRQRSFTDANAIPFELKIRVQCADTLTAASRVSEKPFTSSRNTVTRRATQRPNVTILNMASPLRPGGGFLDGANSQEEFICTRTTLYPSLWDSFYRLPEVGGVHTPDVMVFRDSTPEANELAKRDRFFVDVISAGMLRFPDVRGRADDRSEGCSCGVSYCDRDRELVTRKMKAVLRMAQSKGSETLILGAWGCGAYGNPVKEVAKIWRKVIVGSNRDRRRNAGERWEGIKEIIFAIPDRTMLREFERCFSDVLTYETASPPSEEVDETTESDETNELISKIAETEMQIDQVQNPRSKARLREILAGLNRQLVQGRSAEASREEDLTREEDEQVDEFVCLGSDGEEENNYYNFDENDVASDSSDCDTAEMYEFRFQQPELTSNDEESLDETGDPEFSAGAGFDPASGWFSGSIDHLTVLLKGQGRKISCEASPGSPVLRPDSSGQEIDEMTLKSYLSKYEGSDALD